MPTLSDRSQFQAHEVQQGRYKLAADHLEIVEWIGKEYGVTALDFWCETRKTNKGPSQQLVHLVLGTTDDVKKLQTNRSGVAIGERFLDHFKSTSSNAPTADPTKNDVLPFSSEPFPEIIVTFRPLKYPDGKIMTEMYNEEIRATLKTFESVWTISMSVIFYYTDEQIAANRSNGTSDKIDAELKKVATKYGYRNVSDYRFDSKEAFDRDYESNWYYYWK